MRCSFVTFGCKINQYDTQALREAILELGYEEVAPRERADVVLVNCCTVTARAGEKGAAAVRRLARRNPGATILVTGCLTVEDRQAVTRIPGVRHVIGNEEKDQIPALLQGAELTRIGDRRSRNIFNLRASRLRGHTRAFLKVQDGCDDFCTYCIIPFLRGKSHSRALEDILQEAERMAAAGCRELVITGIHLRQYGQELPGKPSLRELLIRLREIPGVDRVRLSSIGERAFTDSFLELFQSDAGLCPFFHVPLQSGSNTILERMRRDYSVELFLDSVTRIRARLPRAVIATDLMVGFPGETEEHFQESLETCQRARFAFLHVFPYSLRPGTKAAKLPGHLGPEVKLKRVRRARALDVELRAAEGQRWLGRSTQVLVERHGEGGARGLNREGLSISFPATDGENLWNREVPVRVVGKGPRDLLGERIDAVG
ncbi:MAG: tRNA (N(6)-L-threonylcarbamoyladenosine(37)-C(2))-methylthiotransferase MtaB [Planctomycetota bacterium]